MQTLFDIDKNKEFGFPLMYQMHIVSALNRAIEKDMLATSYIFEGAPGSGRYELASQFVRALICENENKIPSCGTCIHCLKIDKGIHPDLIEIKHEERSIKIDEVRYLITEVYRKPNEAERKAVIIRNAERMTIETANALLKVFEEPPLSVVIILTISDPLLLPATVLSRSIRLHFRGIDLSGAIGYISQRYEIIDSDAELLFSVLNGNMELIEEVINDKDMYKSLTANDFFRYAIGRLNPQEKVIEREVAIKIVNLILGFIRYKRKNLDENLYARLLYLLSGTGQLLRGNTNVKVVCWRLMFELKELMAGVKGGVDV
jgi:DNA polymerase III delta prime subunit